MSETESLRRLAEQATPGPWTTWAGHRIASLEALDADGVPYVFARGYSSPRDDANLAFIAAANPTTLLALLDERDALRAQVERVRALGQRAKKRKPPMLHAYEDTNALWRAGRDAVLDDIRDALDQP